MRYTVYPCMCIDKCAHTFLYVYACVCTYMIYLNSLSLAITTFRTLDSQLPLVLRHSGQLKGQLTLFDNWAFGSIHLRSLSVLVSFWFFGGSSGVLSGVEVPSYLGGVYLHEACTCASAEMQLF